MNRRIIMAITIGLLVTLISLSGIVLFTNIIFDGKYKLLKEKIKTNEKTSIKQDQATEVQTQDYYNITKQAGNDIKDLFKEKNTNWVYAVYDDVDNTSNFNIVVIHHDVSYKESLTIGVLDENKYGSIDGEFEKDNIHIKYDKYEYDVKILSENEVMLKKGNKEEKVLKLVEKRSFESINKNDVVKIYEDIIKKLNNNSELSDEEILKVLAFAIQYLDVKKSNKEAILADVGYKLAISKERINELLKETICSGKYQIKDFSNIAKVNSVYSLTDESFSGTKEEYANMYIVDISPSGMDNSGSIVVFSTNDTNYFKVNNFVYKTRKNTMQKIIVKTKMVDGHKCLDY